MPVLEACIAARCHYVDLAEERPWNALVRQLGPRLQAANLTAVHGASSLPGISGALAMIARESCTSPIAARVTPPGPAADSHGHRHSVHRHRLSQKP